MTTNKFVQAVPGDELTAFLRGVYFASNESKAKFEQLVGNEEELHDYCVGTLVLLDMMNKLGNIGLNIPELTGEIKSDIEKVKDIVFKVGEIAEDGLSLYGTEDDKSLLNSSSLESGQYKFSDDDFERVQSLVNELRDIVSKSKSVEEGHKLRLLKRLEKLQSELHKRTSDFDRFWGLFGDIGPIIGKFGKDTKPFVDRIRELMDIVKRTQYASNDALNNKSQHESIDFDNEGENS